MKSFAALCLALASVLTAVAADHPLTPEQARAAFQIEDGLRVELAAAEPSIASPVALAFDERGRMFVAENRSYPHFGKTPPPTRGVIALLEDTDGDGRFEKRTVFADGFTFPNGVLPWCGGLFVTCAPDIFYLKDTDGDGRADVRQVVLTGFGTTSTEQLRVSHPTLGLDGWVYLTSGLVGGQITSPLKPERPAVPFTKNDSRFHPDTFAFEVLGGQAQFGLAFDAAGRRFVCSNRNPLQHVVFEPRHAGRNPHFAVTELIHEAAAPGAAAKVWPLSADTTTAGFMPSLLGAPHAGTFTSACGITIFGGDALTPAHAGNAFVCEPAQNLVQRQILSPNGATFTSRVATPGREFLAARDTWFRPVFATTGPDGALYVCDMYRKTVDHPQYLPEAVRATTDFESGKDKGRIWRIVSEKSPARKKLTNFSKLAPEELVKKLGAVNGWERDTAHRLLNEAATLPATLLRAAVASGANEHARMRALDLQASRGLLESKQLAAAFKDNHPLVRETALLLAESRVAADGSLANASAALATDMDARVRFQCALTLNATRDGAPLSSLVEIAARAGDDRWTRTAVLSAIGTNAPAFLAAAGNRLQNAAYAPIQRDLGKMIGAHRSTNEILSVMTRHLVKTPTAAASAQMALLTGLAEGFQQKAPANDVRLRVWLPGRSVARNEAERLFSLAAEIATNRLQVTTERLNGIQLLAHAQPEFAGSKLMELLQLEEPAEIQLAAVRALGQLRNAKQITGLLDRARWRGYSPTMREAVLSAAFELPAAWPALIDAIEFTTIPIFAITPQRRTQLSKSSNKEVAVRAAKLFASIQSGDRMKIFEEHKVVLAMKTDAPAGKPVFLRTCAACHTHGGEGAVVGPDLTGVRNQPAEALLLHILVPDLEVVPGFTSYDVETRDNRSLTGIILGESPDAIVLRRAGGVTETIPRRLIARLQASALSLMPQGLETTMTRQELADLIAFLKR